MGYRVMERLLGWWFRGRGARWIGTGCARSRGRSDGARIPSHDRHPLHGSTRVTPHLGAVEDITVCCSSHERDGADVVRLDRRRDTLEHFRGYFGVDGE